MAQDTGGEQVKQMVLWQDSSVAPGSTKIFELFKWLEEMAPDKLWSSQPTLYPSRAVVERAGRRMVIYFERTQ